MEIINKQLISNLNRSMNNEKTLTYEFENWLFNGNEVQQKSLQQQGLDFTASVEQRFINPEDTGDDFNDIEMLYNPATLMKKPVSSALNRQDFSHVEALYNSDRNSQHPLAHKNSFMLEKHKTDEGAPSHNSDFSLQGDIAQVQRSEHLVAVQQVEHNDMLNVYKNGSVANQEVEVSFLWGSQGVGNLSHLKHNGSVSLSERIAPIQVSLLPVKGINAHKQELIHVSNVPAVSPKIQGEFLIATQNINKDFKARFSLEQLTSHSAGVFVEQKLKRILPQYFKVINHDEAELKVFIRDYFQSNKTIKLMKSWIDNSGDKSLEHIQIHFNGHQLSYLGGKRD